MVPQTEHPMLIPVGWPTMEFLHTNTKMHVRCSVWEEPTGSRYAATVAAVAPSHSPNLPAEDRDHRTHNTHTNTAKAKGCLAREATGDNICTTVASKLEGRTKC